MTYLRNSSIDHILATSWGRKISADLVAEIEAATGERLSSVEEMREFLAIKRYRELLGRLKVVREGKQWRGSPQSDRGSCEVLRS